MSPRPLRSVTFVLLVAMAVGVPAAAQTDERPHYVRPGAPGEPTQRISPSQVGVVPGPGYSQAEVEFLHHMIPHHGQAVMMAELAADRAESPEVLVFVGRIDVVQAAEIGQMSRWLRIRGEHVPDPMDHEGHHGMPGMVSPQQMEELRAAQGAAFDELFLELMIYHHEGAITMVQELEEATGGYLEATISSLALEIVDSQNTEIGRMAAVLADLRGED